LSSLMAIAFKIDPCRWQSAHWLWSSPEIRLIAIAGGGLACIDQPVAYSP